MIQEVCESSPGFGIHDYISKEREALDHEQINERQRLVQIYCSKCKELWTVQMDLFFKGVVF